MIYLMNSAVMPAGNYGTYVYTPATIRDLVAVMAGAHGEYTSAIGYPQNADLVERWTGVRPEVNRIETRFQHDDRAFVMRLPRRVAPPTKGLPVGEDPKDWEFAWVVFGKGCEMNKYLMFGTAQIYRADAIQSVHLTTERGIALIINPAHGGRSFDLDEDCVEHVVLDEIVPTIQRFLVGSKGRLLTVDEKGVVEVKE